jgi:hypothetical protein
MFVKVFVACLTAILGFPPALASEPSAGRQPSTATQQAREAATQTLQPKAGTKETPLDRRRAELEGKLRVEQVLLKGTGEKGVEIEVRYRIVDVEGYAAHPKTTFVADEASGKLVPLTKLHKLFDPAPSEDAEKRPPASLTLWDKEGVIQPGKPVTVVVAGYGQKGVIPETGPDYDPHAVAKAIVPAPNPLAEPDAKLKVHEVKVVAQGHLLRVTYSSQGIKALDAAEDQTYVENPETGERHPIAKVPRIGVLAPKDIEGLASTYMVIDNAGERIKPGQRVHVVVSGVRAENVPVVGENTK